MLGAILGWAAPCNIEVKFTRIEGRKHASIRDPDGNKVKAPVFTDGEDVKGKVSIEVKPGSKVDHQGIRVELVGQIENQFDKNQNTKFLSLMRDLEPPGTLT
jgi:vacuolar protein sorting-associated protein 26